MNEVGFGKEQNSETGTHRFLSIVTDADLAVCLGYEDAVMANLLALEVPTITHDGGASHG